MILGSRDDRRRPTWLPRAKTVQVHWNDDLALERICSGIDVVIHTAGMNANDCAQDPVAALAFNGVATARLVLAARRMGVVRFVYLSTAHVYASPLVGTITEETCPRNLHPYATSHLAGEQAVLGACSSGNIKGVILRLSNAFGAPTHENVNCWMLVVTDLCRQAVQNGQLVLATSGTQLRDFVSLTEVCRVTEHLVTNTDGAANTGVFNVGGGASQSIIGMAQLIQQRAKQVLGFEPTLHRPSSDAIDSRMSLDYRVDRLATTGIEIKASDNVAEIDELLRHCILKYC